VCAEAPWRTCATSRDCPFGLCVQGSPRRCFPDVVARVGVADPPVNGTAAPTLVAGLCLAPTAMVSVNATLGLPGPATFVLPARVDFRP
jgi:hypothetical protein